MIADALSSIARLRNQASSSASVASDAMTIDGVPTYVVNRLEDAANNFNMQFDNIMRTLKEQVCSDV